MNESTSVRNSRFPRSVQLVARIIQPRYVIHRFPRSVHLDARRNHARNETKCGDFCVSFFKQHIINHQERYSFRATSCTLRFMISCNKLHATMTKPRTERYLMLSNIRNFVQQVARYDLRFRATSCTLRGINRLPKAHTIDKKVR